MNLLRTNRCLTWDIGCNVMLQDLSSLASLVIFLCYICCGFGFLSALKLPFRAGAFVGSWYDGCPESPSHELSSHYIPPLHPHPLHAHLSFNSLFIASHIQSFLSIHIFLNYFSTSFRCKFLHGSPSNSFLVRCSRRNNLCPPFRFPRQRSRSQ